MSDVLRSSSGAEGGGGAGGGKGDGAGTSADSLPGRPAFPACEATAAEKEEEEGGDKTDDEIWGWGYG